MSGDSSKIDGIASSHQAAPPETVASPARGSLKDRIADLQLASKASAARASLAERMKSVHGAAPGATDLKDKLKGAVAAVGIDKLNRGTLKASRDGLAAKVEAFLKPRPVDPPVAVDTPTSSATVTTATTAAAAQPETRTPDGRRDVRLLKARVDDALRSATAQSPDSGSAAVREGAPSPDAAPELTAASIATRAATGPASPSKPSTPVTSRFATVKTALVTRAGSLARTPATARRHTIDGPPTANTTQNQAPTTSTVAEAVTAELTADDPITSRSRRFDTRRIVLAEAKAEQSRPIFSLGLLTTALTAGGVLHILTTFAVPWFNTGSAFERLRWQLEPNVMRIFDADANGQTPLPFLTADMRYAICRYDLTSTSVQVTAVLPDIGWSLALYTPQGDNFYAVPGQDGRIVTAQFTLSTASDRLLLPLPGVRRSDTDATQVTSPQRQGLIVLRAPNLGPAQQRAVDEAMKRTSCRVTSRR